MGLLDIFRRAPPIRDAEALADFIDRNAAFVAQKGIYEYSRARAGHYAKVSFREPEFQAAAERSRWRAYPLGLAMVAELVEGSAARGRGGAPSASGGFEYARDLDLRPLSGASSNRRNRLERAAHRA